MFNIPTVTQIEKVTNNIVNTRYFPENIKKIYIRIIMFRNLIRFEKLNNSVKCFSFRIIVRFEYKMAFYKEEIWRNILSN